MDLCRKWKNNQLFCAVNMSRGDIFFVQSTNVRTNLNTKNSMKLKTYFVVLALSFLKIAVLVIVITFVH